MTLLHHALETTHLHVSLDSNANKNGYSCAFDTTCEHTKFRRHSDLDRHYKTKHNLCLEEDKWSCDYKKCIRSTTDPWTRKDHYRDHLRDYHKEDIPKEKGNEDKQWWDDRKINPNYWRCKACLRTVDRQSEGWTCVMCNKECEEARVKARRQLTDAKAKKDLRPKEGTEN